MRKPGRPAGSGRVQEGLASQMPPGEFTIKEAATAIGATYMSTAHTAANLVREGYLVRVRRGVYRHLTNEEWDAKWAADDE